MALILVLLVGSASIMIIATRKQDQPLAVPKLTVTMTRTAFMKKAIRIALLTKLKLTVTLRYNVFQDNSASQTSASLATKVLMAWISKAAIALTRSIAKSVQL